MGLSCDVYVESFVDYREGDEQFKVLTHYLARENPKLDPDAVRARVVQLHRDELGADGTWLAIMIIRRGDPDVRVFNRFVQGR
jgi:hypothetical protein